MRRMNRKMEIRQEKDGSCSVIYSGCSDTGPSEASLVVVVDNLSPSIFESEVESNSIILGARTEEETSKFEFRFGSLRCSRWMCSAKNKLWWMTPSWGKSLQHIPPETQVLENILLCWHLLGKYLPASSVKR